MRAARREAHPGRTFQPGILLPLSQRLIKTHTSPSTSIQSVLPGERLAKSRPRRSMQRVAATLHSTCQAFARTECCTSIRVSESRHWVIESLEGCLGRVRGVYTHRHSSGCVPHITPSQSHLLCFVLKTRRISPPHRCRLASSPVADDR